MKKTDDFSQYFLYRWRYVIGYSLIGIVLVALLLFAGNLTPAGLAAAEMKSAATSAAVSFSSIDTLAITHMPYHLLQAGIFELFGMNTFTIKLPSLLLGLFSAGGFILLLRRWFSTNVAVLTSLIAISTGQFLFIAQLGGPSIMYIFWPILILLLGTHITRGANKARFIAKIAFVAAVALSLYTPLGIYPLLAILFTLTFHPHLRAIVRKLSKPRLAIAGVVGLILVAPLIYFITTTPNLGIVLLGLPSEPPNLLENATTVFKQYFLFWVPSATTVMTPVFGLGSALIIGLGLYRFIQTRETTRSYLVTSWLLCLVPVLLLNPSFTSVSFVPSVLLMAAGLTSLIGYWYRLFPRNPYARIGGLVPTVILVAMLISTGLVRYAYGYHYTPSVAPLFSKDLALLPNDTKNLVVSSSEKPFYEALAKYRTDLNVTTEPSGLNVTATHQAKAQVGKPYVIKSIVTNPYSNDADRFYLYQKSDK